jgi:putative transposase
MQHDTETRHGRHCIFNMHVHWVFVTKYRRGVFDAAAIDALRDIFQSVCRDFEATLVEMDGEDDHVHLLIEPAENSGVLARELAQRCLQPAAATGPPGYPQTVLEGCALVPSYFAASCGGAPFAIVRQYIEQQKTPD